MAIRKGNKLLQVSVSEEVILSMDKIAKVISEKLKRHYTKGMLITDIYYQWLESMTNLNQESTKEDKKDA